jgi:hypothetical protein
MASSRRQQSRQHRPPGAEAVNPPAGLNGAAARQFAAVAATDPLVTVDTMAAHCGGAGGTPSVQTHSDDSFVDPGTMLQKNSATPAKPAPGREQGAGARRGNGSRPSRL